MGRKQDYAAVVILFAVNLFNYIDRYAVPSVQIQIQEYFGGVSDSEVGLLTTTFIVAYMLCAPVCGYLGDRLRRKWIVLGGLAIWVTVVAASTFVPAGKDNFVWFLLLRAAGGVGEASYATVTPTIISDMFGGARRAQMLMVFFFAIPVGTGLGFVSVSSVASALGGWQWGLRVAPVLALGAMVLIAIFVREPKRGEADLGAKVKEPTSVAADLRYLASNRSWLWVTLGSTAVAFCVGSISVWVPSYLDYGDYAAGRVPSSNSLIFGVCAATGGLVGCAAGSVLSQLWRKRTGTSRPDAWVCGISVLVGCPLAYGAMSLVEVNKGASWVLVALCVTCFSMNWPVVADILMYTTVASRRSTAIAVQTLVLHLLGDAAAPTLIGLFSDSLRGSDASDLRHFKSLQYAMVLPVLAIVAAGVFFLLASFSVDRDRAIAFAGGKLPEPAAQEAELAATRASASLPKPSSPPDLVAQA